MTIQRESAALCCANLRKPLTGTLRRKLVPQMSHLCDTCREARNRALFVSAPGVLVATASRLGVWLLISCTFFRRSESMDVWEDCILFIILRVHLQDTSDRPSSFKKIHGRDSRLALRSFLLQHKLHAPHSDTNSDNFGGVMFLFQLRMAPWGVSLCNLHCTTKCFC